MLMIIWWREEKEQKEGREEERAKIAVEFVPGDPLLLLPPLLLAAKEALMKVPVDVTILRNHCHFQG